MGPAISSRQLKPIADAGFGDQVLRLRRVFLELVLQAPNIDAQVMGVVGLVRSPHHAQQLGRRPDLAGVDNQDRQQPVLGRRQAHSLRRLGHAAVLHVDHHVAEAHFAVAPAAGPR